MANEIRDAFNSVYADGPSASPQQPPKSRIRAEVGGVIQSSVDAVAARIDDTNVRIDDSQTQLGALIPQTADNTARLGPLEASAADHETRIDGLEGAVIAGIKWTSNVVRVRSTGNVAIATALENGDTLNGVTLATGNHVFLGSQTAPAENGLYTVVASGAASRATWADSAAELSYIGFTISEGTTGAGEAWTLNMAAGSITLGTTALAFSPAPGAATGIAADVNAAKAPSATLKIRIDTVEANSAFAGGRALLDAPEGVTIDLAAQTVASRSLSDNTKNFVQALGTSVATARSTTKFVTTKAGLLSSVAIDTNAYDYAGQGGLPIGMTVYPQSQSYLHFSDVTGLWSATALTVTLNSAAGPDGVVNATLLTPDGTNGAHRIFATASGVAASGAYRCFSVYVKRPSGSANVRLSSGGNTGEPTATVDFNLSTGVATVSSGQPIYSIQQLNSGWWRISIAHAPTLTFMQPTIWLLDSAMNFSHAGTDPLLVIKARADAGRLPLYPVDFRNSSLYPTTGADKPTVSLSGRPAANGATGTISCIARPSEDGADYGRVLWQIDDGDDSDCIRLTNGGAGIAGLRLQVISGGSVLHTSDVSPAGSASDRFRVVASWSENEIALSVNGFEFSRYRVAMPAATYTTLRIGHRAAGDQQWWGAIEKIVSTPRSMTHTEIWGADVSAGDTSIVIGATGQSNMFGARVGGDLTINPNVFAWDNAALRWVVATPSANPFGPGFGANAASNNLAFHAAKRIQAATGKKVYLILHAWSGQPIRKWCKVGERPFRDTFFAEVVSALAALGKTKLDGVLWHQGEADANYLRTVGTFGPLLTDVRTEHASEHLYRAGLLAFIDDVRTQAWADANTPFIVGELVHYPGTDRTTATGTTDDRCDVLSNIGRYHPRNYCVPSAGLTIEDPLVPQHFDGIGLQHIGERYGDVWLGIGQGIDYDPNDDNRYRKIETIAGSNIVPVHIGQRNALLFSSGSAASTVLDPLEYDLNASFDVENQGLSTDGNLTVTATSPGRLFQSGQATATVASVVIAPGQKYRFTAVADVSPGAAQAFRVTRLI